ncbi:signal peptidase I [candidate division KSB1 bacterium]|nr:signal peptidase I [candidate division KSB1 bacterium]RQW05668.1 MAG: signal peptidase I [candidate division KSB1 bacterium]
MSEHTESNNRKKQSVISEYVQALCIAIFAALLLRIFVVQAFRIPTGSMKDTLLIGDFLLVNKFIYGVRTPDRIPGTTINIPYGRLPAFRSPRRGDVIVFKFPSNTSVDYIKRCVGLPGDTVLVRHNSVYVNGVSEGEERLLQKKYDPQENATFGYYQITTPDDRTYIIRKKITRPSALQNYGPVVVPPEHFFMMGDNRDNSSDSRFWGFLPSDYIVGRALMIYFSFDAEKWQSRWRVFEAVRWQRLFNLIR